MLNEPGLACTRKRVCATACARSFVEVLPFAPVMPTTVAVIEVRSSAAKRINASAVEPTRTVGLSPFADPSASTIAAAAPPSKA